MDLNKQKRGDLLKLGIHNRPVALVFMGKVCFCLELSGETNCCCAGPGPTDGSPLSEGVTWQMKAEAKPTGDPSAGSNPLIIVTR